MPTDSCPGRVRKRKREREIDKCSMYVGYEKAFIATMPLYEILFTGVIGLSD